MRRGSLDADVHRLLTHEEEEEYQSKSLKAAAHRYRLTALDEQLSYLFTFTAINRVRVHQVH